MQVPKYGVFFSTRPDEARSGMATATHPSFQKDSLIFKKTRKGRMGVAIW